MQTKKISIAILAGLFFSCHSNVEKTDTEDATVRAEVSVVNPTLQSLSGYAELNATTQYQRKSTIRATVSGYLSGLNLLPGDAVNAGKIFCSIFTKEQRALQGIDTSELKGFNHPQAIISPAQGIVSELKFRSGDFVSEGDEIAIVAEPASLMLQMNVPFEFRNLTRTGTVCDVILPDGEKVKATIVQQMPNVDVTSQTQVMLLRLNGNSVLPENMNVIIHIPQRTKLNALCVPGKAVQTDEAQTTFWVLKVVNDSLAIKVNVECGISQDGMQEIISDRVSVHDLIISEGGYGLADSTFIMINK
ncbi:MAG: HlyD family efflux transporter periplasmic adaptor subunit [Bacteroidetes bacterium]|nr:HlyD family efflux transporter periplasmic adaptor subunit [Bacteroidota bacterium]